MSRGASTDAGAAQPVRFLWLIPGLGLLTCLGPFSNDVFVPSLSLVAAGLDSNAGAVQLTMTALLIGFSLGSLLYGPMSDRFGRKPMLCVGLVIYALAAAVAAIAPTLTALIVMRAIQGFGASSTMVLTRAIVLDRWAGAQASRVLSWIAIFMFIAPVLAPLIGGLIASLGHWPTVFWVQSGIGAFALLMTALFLPRAHVRKGASVLAGIRTYAIVLSSADAIGYMMCTGLAFIGLITFVSNSSLVFVDYFGLSPRMQGACFSIVMLGAAVGSFINGRLVTVRGISTMIGLGTTCLALGGTATLAVCLADAGVAPLVAAVMIYAFGIGFVFANTVARTMSHFRENAGAVSAVFAVNQFLFGAIVTAGLSTISTPSLIPVGVAIGFAGIMTAVLWWGWLRNTAFTRFAAGNAA